jgi:gluconolactonase
MMPATRLGPSGQLSRSRILTIDPHSTPAVNTAIQRLWTGMWCEGPAWSGEGRYLVWSDIPNNRQLRWLEDDGRVTVFRMPSNNSNGNAFDYLGRQVSCEHGMRRVVRYELDGSITVLADRYNGSRLNSPNDLAPHPDGSVWFTDPPFGGALYEGAVDPAGGPGNQTGRINSRLGQLVGLGESKREMTTSNVYRVDANGKIAGDQERSWWRAQRHRLLPDTKVCVVWRSSRASMSAITKSAMKAGRRFRDRAIRAAPTVFKSTWLVDAKTTRRNAWATVA